MVEFSPPPPLTEGDLVELIKRNFEPHWIEGLLDDPSSSSIFYGMIAQALRCQEAGDLNLGLGAFIMTAVGRAHATSVVRLTRPSGSAVTIGVEVRFVDDRGAVWVPVAAVDIPASGVPQMVDIPIQTDRWGYYLNSFEPLTYQAMDDLPDANLVPIVGPDPAEGGTSPYLDQHGKERKVFRSPLESDVQYRQRIRFLVDQVSPTAIADTVPEVFDLFPITQFITDLIFYSGLRAVREPFRDTAQLAQRGLQGSDQPFADDRAYADDTHGHILRDFEDTIAWFDVLMPTPPDPDEARIFFDEGYFDDPLFGYPDLPPGDALIASVAALADELNRRRAGGVRFRIIQGGNQNLIRHPELNTLAQAGDWMNQNGSATDQNLVEALPSHDADFTYVESTTGRGNGAPATAGDLIFNAPDVPDPLTVSHVVLRATARKSNVSAGVDPQLAFMVRPSNEVAAVRVLSNMAPFLINHTEYREYVAILEQNPVTAAAWTVANFAGTFGFGVANAAAVGPTEQLRVSELTIEFVLSYG